MELPTSSVVQTTPTSLPTAPLPTLPLPGLPVVNVTAPPPPFPAAPAPPIVIDPLAETDLTSSDISAVAQGTIISPQTIQGPGAVPTSDALTALPGVRSPPDLTGQGSGSPSPPLLPAPVLTLSPGPTPLAIIAATSAAVAAAPVPPSPSSAPPLIQPVNVGASLPPTLFVTVLSAQPLAPATRSQVLTQALGADLATLLPPERIAWRVPGPGPGAAALPAALTGTLIIYDEGSLRALISPTSPSTPLQPVYLAPTGLSASQPITAQRIPWPILTGLESVYGGDLIILGTGVDLFRVGTGLGNLSPLASLRAVSGVLRIVDTALESLDLPQLRSIGGLVLQGNLLLQSAAAPSTRTQGTILLEGFNYRLPSLAGLPIPSLVQGDLRLWGLFNLSSTASLATAQQIQGSLEVTFCPLLRDLLGLRSVGSIQGDLIITRNDGMLTVNGLDNLQIVYGNVIVTDNPSLKHLIGLRNLAKIGGQLVLERNEQLTTLPDNLLGLISQK